MKGLKTSVCLNTECIMSLVDKNFLREHCLHIMIHIMTSSMKVWGISLTSHSVNEYAWINFYLSDKDRRTAYFQWEIYLMKNLKANLLMRIDIISSENINVDSFREITTVRSCNSIQLALSIKTCSVKVHKTVFSYNKTWISAHTQKALSIHDVRETSLNLLKNWDMLFELSVKQNVSVFAHIVNHSMKVIYVQNDSDFKIILSWNTRMSNVIEYEADRCFLTSINDNEIVFKPACKSKRTDWIRQVWKEVLVTATTTVMYEATASELNSIIHTESKLLNQVTDYRDWSIIETFNKVVKSYSDLWVNHSNTVRVSELK